MGREFLGIWSMVQKVIGGMGRRGLDFSLRGTEPEEGQSGAFQSIGLRAGATNTLMFLFHQAIRSIKAGLVSL